MRGQGSRNLVSTRVGFYPGSSLHSCFSIGLVRGATQFFNLVLNSNKYLGTPWLHTWLHRIPADPTNYSFALIQSATPVDFTVSSSPKHTVKLHIIYSDRVILCGVKCFALRPYKARKDSKRRPVPRTSSRTWHFFQTFFYKGRSRLLRFYNRGCYEFSLP